MRHVLLIGDDSLVTPVELAADRLGWTFTTFSTVAKLKQAIGRGEFTFTGVDGVILSEPYSGDNVEEVAAVVGTITYKLVPAVLVTYSRTGFEWYRNNLERVIATAHSEFLAENPGATRGPSDVDIALVLNTQGTGTLLSALGHTMRVPADMLAFLQADAFKRPLPVPQVEKEAVVKGGGHRGKVVAFTSFKGGAGKTTMTLASAAKLAYRTAHRGDDALKVVVVDADKQSQLRDYFPDIREQHNITKLDVHSSPVQVKDTLFQPAPEALPNLFILPGDSSNKAHKAVRTKDLYEHVIGTLLDSGLADIVLVDTAVDVSDDPVMRWVFQSATRAYYVLDFGPSTLRGAMEAHAMLVATDPDEGGIGMPGEAFALIPNMLPPDASVLLDALDKNLPGVALAAQVPFLSTVREQSLSPNGIFDVALNDPELDVLNPVVDELTAGATFDTHTPAPAAKKKKWGFSK